MHAWLDDSDDHLRWLVPTDLNLDYMGITHLDCVTLVFLDTSSNKNGHLPPLDVMEWFVLKVGPTSRFHASRHMP